MWPPYGLGDSAKATEALGVEISFNSCNPKQAKSEYTTKTHFQQGSSSRPPMVSSLSSEDTEAVLEKPFGTDIFTARNDKDASLSRNLPDPEETPNNWMGNEALEERQLISSGSTIVESVSCVRNNQASVSEVSPADSVGIPQSEERAENEVSELEHPNHHTFHTHDRAAAPHMQIVESKSPLRVDPDKQNEVTLVAS